MPFLVPFRDYQEFEPQYETTLEIPPWDETFMHDAYWWARRSKDPRTKIGAVLVHWDSKDAISHAYNGFARKVNDDIPERWERPEKYFWVSHAESNAILNCSRTGRSAMGTIMFTQGIPCADCSNDIIQAGIKEIVVHKQWQEYELKFNWEKWKDSSKRSAEKLKEANIPVRVFDKVLGLRGFLDGKVINI
jgi:dCMP deaminase